MNGAQEERISRVLAEIADFGPYPDAEFISNDPEVKSISKKFSLPIESIAAIKYLSEHGPDWDELIDNAWNVGFSKDSRNDRDEEADDTICPYEGCDGYQSEFEAHNENCPYIVAIELMKEWRRE